MRVSLVVFGSHPRVGVGGLFSGFRRLSIESVSLGLVVPGLPELFLGKRRFRQEPTYGLERIGGGRFTSPRSRGLLWLLWIHQCVNRHEVPPFVPCR